MAFFPIKAADPSQQGESSSLLRIAPAVGAGALTVFDSSTATPISFTDATTAGLLFSDITHATASDLVHQRCLTNKGSVGLVSSVSVKSIPGRNSTGGKVCLHVRYHDQLADIKADAETVFKECLAYKSAETKQIAALGPKVPKLP